MSEWSYPAYCCAGGDCAAINGVRVRPLDGGGFLVDGKHYIPRSQVRRSEDGQYHGCFPSAEQLKCFFAPPGMM